MSTILNLTFEEAQAYNDFYHANYPKAQYYVISYSGKVVEQGFNDYVSAFTWGLDYQKNNPADIVDVWVKTRESQEIARESA
jgi:hypothetical protein